MEKIHITESDIKKMVKTIVKEVFDNTSDAADKMFYNESNIMKTINTILNRGGWE